MKKYFTKPIAFILAVVMLMQVVPMHGFANESTAAPIEQLSDVPSASGVYQEPSLHIREDVSLRTVDSKVFENEDGSGSAYVYPQAVHFEDGNGGLQEYDNTLVKQGDFFAPKASGLDIAMPAVLGGDKAITMSDGRFGFSLGVPGANSEAIVPDLNELEMIVLQEMLKDVDLSEATEEDINLDSFSVEYFNQQMSSVRNLESVIYYPDAFPGAHLEYTVLPEKIKENIYVMEKQKKYVYSYTLDLKNLVAVQQDERTIHLFCSLTGDLRVTIEAPFAVDAAGEMNTQALTLALDENVLTVTADKKWMNAKEREFPVTLDPTFSFSVNTQTMANVSVNNKIGRSGDLSFKVNVGSRKGFTGLLGNTGVENKNRSFLRFEMPELPNDAVVTNATLMLDDNATPAWAKMLYWLLDFMGPEFATDLVDWIYYFWGQETRGYTVDVRAEMVLEEWISDWMLWSNQPKTTGVALAIGNDDPETPDRSWWKGKGLQGLHTFDITEAVKHWIEVGGNENYGIMLKAEDEEKFTENFLQFASLSYQGEIDMKFVNFAISLFMSGAMKAIEAAIGAATGGVGFAIPWWLKRMIKFKIPNIPIHINRLDSEPVVSIQFISATGLEDYYSYETVGMGRAGEAYVNQFNGALTYVQPVAEMSGERMPVGLSHVYNSNHDRSNGELWNMKMGVGFRMSLFEQLNPINNYEPFNLIEDLTVEAIDRVGKLLQGTAIPNWLYNVVIDAMDSPRQYYTLIDGDGTEHCFVQHEDRERRDEFVSEVNKKIILRRESLSEDGFRFTLEDEYGNQKIYTDSRFVEPGFSTPDELDEWKNVARHYYYLNTIRDANGNETNIYYETDRLKADFGRIMKVVDTIGREFNFEYDAEGYLSKITDQVGRTTQFEYDTNVYVKDTNETGHYVPVLKQITYHDGQKTTFTYADKQDKNAKDRNRTRLVAVTNPDEHHFVFGLERVDTSRRSNYLVKEIQHGISGSVAVEKNPDFKEPDKKPLADKTGDFWQRVFYWISRAVYELVWNIMLRPDWFLIDDHGRWYFSFRAKPDPDYGDKDEIVIPRFSHDVSTTWLQYGNSRTTVISSLGEAAGVTYAFDRVGRAVGARDNTTGEQAFVGYTQSDGVQNLPGFAAGTAVVRNLLGEPSIGGGVTVYTENEVVQAVAGKQFWSVASGNSLKFSTVSKLDRNENYTLSLFARQSPSSSGTLVIEGCGADEQRELTDEWARYIVTFSNGDDKALDISLKAVGGDILIDAVQLEKNNTASPYNYLANSYFSEKHKLASWNIVNQNQKADTDKWVIANKGKEDEVTEVVIHGDPNTEKALQQEIQLSQNAAGQMLLFGATASIVAARDEDEKTRVTVEFYKKDGTPIELGDKLKEDEEEKIRFLEWLKKCFREGTLEIPDEWRQIRPVEDDDDKITNVDGNYVFANFNRDIKPKFEINKGSNKWYQFRGREERAPSITYSDDEKGIQTTATAYVIPDEAVRAVFRINYDNQATGEQNAMRVQEAFAYIGAGGTIFDYMGGKLQQAVSGAGIAKYTWEENGPNLEKVEITRPRSREDILNEEKDKINPRRVITEYTYDDYHNVTSMTESRKEEGKDKEACLWLVTKTTYDYEKGLVNTYQRNSRFLNLNWSNDTIKRVDTAIGGILTGSTAMTFTWFGKDSEEGEEAVEKIPASGVVPLASKQTIEYITNYADGRANDFNDVKRVTDGSTGQWAEYSYQSRANNIPDEVTGSDDSRATYQYNEFVPQGANNALDILTSIRAYDGANVYENEYNYTGFGAGQANTVSGMLSSIKRNGTEYSFGYDIFGQAETVKIGGQTLVTNKYFGEAAEKSDDTGKIRRFALEESTYANGFQFKPDYDERGRVVAERWGKWDSLQFKYVFGNKNNTTYIYGNSGLISRIDDDDSNRETQFDYDMQGRTTGINMKSDVAADIMNSTVRLGYRNEGELEDFRLLVNGNQLSRVKYTYDMFDRPSVTTFDGGELQYNYDAQTGRLNSTSLNGGLAETHFTYKDNGETTVGNTTAKLAGNVIGMTNTLPGGATTFGYEYKPLSGNIQAISVNGVEQHRYAYDKIGQLKEETAVVTKTVTEIDEVTGETIEKQEPEDVITKYAYDVGGNLRTITEKIGDEVEAVTKAFGYNNPNWRDQLTVFDGKQLKYDAIGNLEEYDEHVYTWDKARQLASISGSKTNAQYAYDYTGLRSSKTVGGVTTNFIWASSLLMAQMWKEGDVEHKLAWSYSDGGSMLGFTLNGVPYFYQRNMQNDVVAIYNTAGEVVARYSYDAWGNILDIWQADGYTVGEVNPIRYRGYYYDNETDYYYCQSRYYNPEWCRWISADVYMDTQDGILGTNMYAYCQNDPVNMVDPSGYFSSDDVKMLSAIFQWALSPDGKKVIFDVLEVGANILPFVLADYGDVIGYAIENKLASMAAPMLDDALSMIDDVLPFADEAVSMLDEVVPFVDDVVGATAAAKNVAPGDPSLWFSADKNAVIQLAKEHRRGASMTDAQTLVEWAGEYGLNNHGPMIHPNRNGIWSYTNHVKVANYHIPIK